MRKCAYIRGLEKTTQSQEAASTELSVRGGVEKSSHQVGSKRLAEARRASYFIARGAPIYKDGRAEG